MTPQPIKGLPEGVEFIELKAGTAADEDYEIVGGVIRKGPRAGAASGVIVKPSPGYAFVPQRIFDIRQFKYVAGPENHFMVVKQTDPKDVKATLTFNVSNDFDHQAVMDMLRHCQALSGFVDLKVE